MGRTALCRLCAAARGRACGDRLGAAQDIDTLVWRLSRRPEMIRYALPTRRWVKFLEAHQAAEVFSLESTIPQGPQTGTEPVPFRGAL
jgi:hypothetical protein